MASYTKTELLNDIAEQSGVTKTQAESVINALFETVITKARAGEKVAWPGFGAFSTSQRAARTGRNPQTGAEIKIAASTAMKFTAAKALKDALNG